VAPRTDKRLATRPDTVPPKWRERLKIAQHDNVPGFF
jgi:hypothetical protein